MRWPMTFSSSCIPNINLGGVGGQLLQFNQMGFKVQINGISRQLALDLMKRAWLLALNFASTKEISFFIFSLQASILEIPSRIDFKYP